MIVIWKMINSLSFFFLFLRDMSKPGEAHYYEWPSHEPPGVESAPRKSRWRSLSRRDWVDIGAPSLRNLFKGRIAIERRLLWAGIVLTSVPLHLLLAYPYRQKGPSLQGILLTDS